MIEKLNFDKIKATKKGKGMKKLLSISVIAIFAITPTFADNEPTVIPTPANCNEAVLNTTEGSADLEAIYTANTINTTWYSGYGNNASVANATQCSYDGTINLPQTNPSRPGYAFDGWRLRPDCSLTSIDTSVNGTGYRVWGETPVGSTNTEYQLYDPAYQYNAANDNWLVSFPSNREVIGQSFCSEANNGNVALGEFGTPTGRQGHYFMGDSYQTGYCWCRVTKSVNGSSQCDVQSDWKFLGGMSGCLLYCSSTCAQRVYNETAFRESLYGAAE